MNPTLPEMPDVMDTGTIIGKIPDVPKLTPHQSLNDNNMLIIPNDDDDDDDDHNNTNNNNNNDNEYNSAMDTTTSDEPIDEEDALRSIELLRGDDITGRVTAARKLHSIAAALGPERTRDELLPFLSDGVDDEDEVLEAVAISLGKLVPYVGGARYAASLLPTLELLLAVEEGVVREKASKSAVAISECMEDDVYRREFVGMIGRLATKEWFTARISACGLIPLAFSRMSPELQVSYILLDCYSLLLLFVIIIIRYSVFYFYA